MHTIFSIPDFLVSATRRVSTGNGSNLVARRSLRLRHMRAENDPKTVEWVKKFKSTIKGASRPDLHFYSLSDEKRIRVCEWIPTLELRWFSVVSNKKNVAGYENPRAAKKDTRSPWYHWFLRLLLERASQFCFNRTMKDYGEIRTMRIELGSRGGLTAARAAAYLYYIRNQSRGGNLYLDKGDLAWDVINLNDIHVLQARSRAGIQLADTVASAFKQAVDPWPNPRPTPEYALALKPVVAKDSNGRVANFGVKLLPSPPALWRAGLTDAHIDFFSHYGYSREYLVSPAPDLLAGSRLRS